MAWDWTRDEVILACDLVSRNEWRELNRKSPALEELSDLLRAADIHPRARRPDNFRSLGSVRRKVADIASQHPTYSGKPTRGGSHDKPVLLEFIANTSQMQAEAARIREGLRSSGRMLPIELDVDHGVLEADEGQELFVQHLRRERDRALRASKLSAVRAEGRPIACEVCGFDFAATYGALGEGYIEVHHRLPLHASGPVKTRLEDLALLCSNCHRMIHRARPWLRPEELARVMPSAQRP